jgi:hypothetical protein
LRALLGDVASRATTKVAGETDILVIPRAVAHHGGAGVDAVTECVRDSASGSTREDPACEETGTSDLSRVCTHRKDPLSA